MLSLSADLSQEDMLASGRSSPWMKSDRENGLTGSQKVLPHKLAYRGLLPLASLLPINFESVDLVAVHP